jgi:hypothetical protein
MFQSSITFLVALNPITTRAASDTSKCISSRKLKAIIIDKTNTAEAMALSSILL